MQTTSSVLTQVKENLAILTLNRPDCLNAMNKNLVDDFHTALTELEDDTSVRVIILTGAGRAFCAGGDLRYIESLKDNTSRRQFIKRVGEMALRIKNSPKPIIAMINGVTAGAGVNLMLACDIVCSVDSAKFIQSFVNVGLIPDCGGMYLLKQTVGLQKAKELMFTADVVTAKEAKELNMVMHLYAKDKLITQTEKLAQKIASGAPLAISYMKSMINKSYNCFADFLDEESSIQTLCLSSQDCAEGITAFKEKRPPKFIGK